MPLPISTRVFRSQNFLISTFQLLDRAVTARSNNWKVDIRKFSKVQFSAISIGTISEDFHTGAPWKNDSSVTKVGLSGRHKQPDA